MKKPNGTLSTLIISLFLLCNLFIMSSGLISPQAAHSGIPLENNEYNIEDSFNTKPQIANENLKADIEKTAGDEISSTYYKSHKLTKEEVVELKSTVGVYDPNQNYCQVYNGLGTGLTPPTEEDWNSMIGAIDVVESVMNTNLPSFVDHSQSVYFPAVRSQGSQNSCSSWMTTYYAQGYYQAREFKWTGASTGNNNQLLNPSWTYNKVNKGYDKGSNFWRNWNALNKLGAVTWSTMPFDSKDDISWGPESAWREAPMYRAGSYMQTDVNNIDVVRAWVSDGFICPISINSSEYEGLGVGDDTITSVDYNSTSHNHANAVVGYDDNKVVDGERGAFKIVNSWGDDWGTINGGRNNLGGWNGDGYYWMTYNAFTELVMPVYTFYDKVGYEPELLATWHFEGNCSRDSAIWLYLGSTSTPVVSRNLYRNAGSHNYPNFLCLDVTEFYDFASLETTYLKIFTGTNKTNISSFKLELYDNGYSTDNSTATIISPESSDVPKLTPCTVENIVSGGHVKINFPLDNGYYTGNILSSGTAKQSITHTLLFDDFEEEFPGSWEVGDYNSTYGEDYWGGTTERYNSGFKSAWCAQVKEPIFSENFDTGGTLPTGWATRSENATTSQPWEVNNTGYDFVYGGEDYAVLCNSYSAGAGTNITEWLYTTSGFNASLYSHLSLGFLLVYYHFNGDEFAEVLYANGSTYPNFTSLKVWTTDTFGYQQVDLSMAAGENKVYLAFRYHGTFDHYMLIDDVTVITNSTSNEYDHGMTAYLYQSVNLTGYDVVELTYDYWVNSENLKDTLRLMYYSNSHWHFPTAHTGSSSGWKSNFLTIPIGCEYIGFQFESDNSSSGFEGAYIDNVKVTGTLNLSSVESCIDTGSWSPVQGKTTWTRTINTISYSDGGHKFSVRGKYGAFNSLDFVEFIIDNNPPESFIPHVTPANWSSNTQPVLTFETTDVTSKIDYYEVKLDSGSFNMQSSPYILPIQTEGAHVVIVRAYDILGHYRDGTSNYYIDTSMPTTFQPTAEPGNWTNNPQPLISFSTSDSVSGVQRYMLKIDDGNFTNESSPFVLPTQPDGIHRITVRAYDLAQNYIQSDVNVYIDTTPPEMLSVTPPSRTWLADNTPQLAYSATDATSGVDHFELRVDSGLFNEYPNPCTLPALADGERNITVRAYDQAGNYIETWLDLLIDTTPPNPFSPVAQPSTWTNTPPEITFSTTDATSGVAYYEVKLNEGSFSTQTSPYSPHKLKDGVHNLTIRAHDYAGNYIDGYVNLYIDSELPSVQVVTPENNSWVNLSNPEIHWEHTDKISGVQKVELTLDEEMPIVVDNGTSYAFPSLRQGEHALMVSVFDIANNIASQQIKFKVDSTKPLITITNPTKDSYFALPYLSVSWTGSDEPSGIRFFELKIDDNPYQNTGTTTTRKLLGLSDGEHTVYIRAYDVAGNFDVVSVLFYTDTTKPTLVVSEPSSGSIITTSDIICKWTGEDSISGIQQYEIKLDDSEFENLGKKTSHTFSGLVDGAHHICIKATDNTGNSAEVTFIIEIDTSEKGGDGGGINKLNNILIVISTIILIVVLLIILLLFFRKRRRAAPALPEVESDDAKSNLSNPPASINNLPWNHHRAVPTMPFNTKDQHQLNPTPYYSQSIIQQPVTNNAMLGQSQNLTFQQNLSDNTRMRPGSPMNNKGNMQLKNDEFQS